MTLEEYRKSSGQRCKFKHKGVVFKLLLSLFVLLSIVSIYKLSPSTKELIKEELFQTNFNFSYFNNIFSKIFTSDEVSKVNNEITKYKNYSLYLDGVKVDTSVGDSVSLIESGIVVYVGEKEGYGNTVIIQQSNGIDVWYGNLDNINVNLYDYLNKNTIIGTSNDSLYLVFQKNGEYLDYKNYI